MEDNEVDSKTKISEKIDIGSELSALVEKNVISRRIADRLEQKLKEKQIKINKEQLNVIVRKIGEIIRTYTKTEHPTKSEGAIKTAQPAEKKIDSDMQQLIETVEKLQEKLTNIENGYTAKDDKKFKTSAPKIVTTDDIKIPKGFVRPGKEFKLDPLTEIPNDPESIIVLMKWLQYLIDKCGRANLSAILDYYVDIGWISQDAKISLIDYSHGITEDKSKLEITRKDAADLPSKDHIQSLFFIQKLKGIEIDKRFIDRIDSELNRMTKKLDSCRSK